MASMSKRAQARTEKELHDLLRTSGNSTCADCGARNPSWASWNLGVFLCMRCASIHRKLGTHISKVKSLSMDTWSNEQVENMKQNGNLAVNKVYNPKNKRPDMPLDADEVDSAMERFIRKKYQEKSLSDGRPEVPSRDDVLPPRSKSPDTAPPPVMPSRKSKFFGFGLRASSSAYPLSKHDKKKRNEPQVDSAFRISSEDYTSASRTNGSRAEISDYDLQVKLAQLRDMGFTDNERNTNILKRQSGDIERTIAALVKLGPSEQPATRKAAPAPVSTDFPMASTPAQTSISAPQSATLSNNPYDQLNQSSGFGLSLSNNTRQANPANTNPWQNAVSNQQNTGLEQSFSNMQVSQPLFPHSTGGHPGQQPHFSQATAPSMPSIPQQYALTSSPASTNNPFMQTLLSAHSTGSNPYAAHMQSMPTFAPATNPFMSMQGPPTAQQPPVSAQGYNPFGLPPTSSPPQALSQPNTSQSQPGFYDVQSSYAQPGPQSPSYGGMQYAAQQQTAQSYGAQSPPPLPNFQYGQPQAYQQQMPQSPVASPQANPFLQQQQVQQPQAQPQPQQQTNRQAQFNSWLSQQEQQQQQQRQPQSPVASPQANPFLQQQQMQQQQYQQHQGQQATQHFQQQQQQQPNNPYSQQYQPQQQQPQQNQPLMPQMTGHMDKRSILALYGMPQMAPNRQLASIPEPADDQGQPQQQTTSPTPSGAPYGSDSINVGKRSATMPVSSMSSAGGGTGSRNPFMSAANNTAMPAGYRHTSHDSMAVNNPGLQDGRHSPDAFASLSARYMR